MSEGDVRGIFPVKSSREMGLLVVLVARYSAVNLGRRVKPPQLQAMEDPETYMTFLGCQSMTVFFR